MVKEKHKMQYNKAKRTVQYCEEIEKQLNRVNTEKSDNLIRKMFRKPKLKHTIIE
jgi:hypothetical protein